jgi:hypothetical protein
VECYKAKRKLRNLCMEGRGSQHHIAPIQSSQSSTIPKVCATSRIVIVLFSRGRSAAQRVSQWLFNLRFMEALTPHARPARGLCTSFSNVIRYLVLNIGSPSKGFARHACCVLIWTVRQCFLFALERALLCYVLRHGLAAAEVFSELLVVDARVYTLRC